MDRHEQFPPPKEAKIGTILVSISLIVSIGVIALLAFLITATVLGRLTIAGLSLGGAVVLLMVKTAGLILGVGVLRGIRRRSYRTAGRTALCASVLPPLDLLMLVSGLLFYAIGNGDEP
jgi:hypothetical protein